MWLIYEYIFLISIDYIMTGQLISRIYILMRDLSRLSLLNFAKYLC